MTPNPEIVAHLLAYEGATAPDIAAALGLDPRWVSSHLLRCLLAQAVTREGEKPFRWTFVGEPPPEPAESAERRLVPLRVRREAQARESAERMDELVALVRLRPGIGAKRAAAILGCIPSWVRRRAIRAEAAGLLRFGGTTNHEGERVHRYFVVEPEALAAK